MLKIIFNHTTSDSKPSSFLQDSDEEEEDEDMAMQSGSEGTSSEPREDHTDASSVEVTSSRPRRAATLRRAFSAGNPTGGQEAPEGRRRSTRSLSTYSQSDKYQPPKGQDVQVQTERQHTDGGSVVSNELVSRLVKENSGCPNSTTQTPANRQEAQSGLLGGNKANAS